ncbi:hypothetical protein C3477_10250 [Mycobacterium kansasii]|nr:hypothetical protein C3B43_13530 [Mycobacterium kansasii]POY06509.1 hypothetical protein C3477_10250 [Mycobacterium kansasii]POY19757.1 hypothetical protein C3476_16770 [Mycobacterium kansasii]
MVDLSFWMRGVSRDGPADPKTVISTLVAGGWSTGSDFISHSPALRKKDVNAIVTVVPPALHGEGFNSHVGVKLDGECRDTFDHRKDHSILPVDIGKDIQQS